jgi:hypothetical protein
MSVIPATTKLAAYGHPEMNDFMQYVLTFVGGGIAGTLLTFWFELGRDKRNRRYTVESERRNRLRSFRGFLSGFRSWVERSSISELGEKFSDKVHEFRVETATIREDVPLARRERFDTAVLALCRTRASEVCERQTNYKGVGPRINYVGRDRLAAAIDEVGATLDDGFEQP